MLLLTLPLAILIGVLVGKYYRPESSFRKLLVAFLLPIVSGFLLNVIIASANNSFSFWENYGRWFFYVAIPELALLVTLLIAVKVDKEKTKWSDEIDTVTKVLQYVKGDDMVEFEIELTEQEVAKMDELRKQEPERWKDNDYELVNEAKRQLILKCADGKNCTKTEGEKGSDIESLTEPKTKDIELKQDGIVVTVSLTDEILEQMAVLRSQSPERWKDNEVELVKAAKRKLKGVFDKEPEGKAKEEVSNDVNGTKTKNADDFIASNSACGMAEQETDIPLTCDEKTKVSDFFGGKLESEYRRESKAESHWIRQDDTDICINIEEAVYKKMVELQNENPKKWVNKELDLFKKAKNMLLGKGSPKRNLFKRN